MRADEHPFVRLLPPRISATTFPVPWIAIAVRVLSQCGLSTPASRNAETPRLRRAPSQEFRSRASHLHQRRRFSASGDSPIAFSIILGVTCSHSVSPLQSTPACCLCRRADARERVGLCGANCAARGETREENQGPERHANLVPVHRYSPNVCPDSQIPRESDYAHQVSPADIDSVRFPLPVPARNRHSSQPHGQRGRFRQHRARGRCLRRQE